jgi:hypothetical protein
MSERDTLFRLIEPDGREDSFSEIPKAIRVNCIVEGRAVTLAFIHIPFEIAHLTAAEDRPLQQEARVVQRLIVTPEGSAAASPSREPVSVIHVDLDSFVGAIADCRAAGGDLIPCDNPMARRIGYVHHPDAGDSVFHEIGLGSIKGTVLSEEVAASFGMTAAEFRKHLSTPDGRQYIAMGREPAPVPDMDEELAAAMLAAPLRADVKYDPDAGKVSDVEFPELVLFRDVTPGMVKAVMPDPWGTPRAARPLRPAWLPAGWSTFVLPDDADRLGVEGEAKYPDGVGYFARRGERMFLAFSDGAWQTLTCHPPMDTATRYVPGGYRVDKSGRAADVESAVDAVLPHYLETKPILPQGG